MSRALFTIGSAALLLCACNGSSDPAGPTGSVAPGTPVTPAGSVTIDEPTGTDVPSTPSTRFLTVPEAPEDSAWPAAQLTREACFADYTRLASLLGTASAIERFHAIGGGRVDVEWIEPDAVSVVTDGPVETRQGAGAVLSGQREADGGTRCAVAGYESYGFADATGRDGTATLQRLDAQALACAPDSTHPDVTIGNIPLFLVEDGEGVHAYGSIGRSYTLVGDGEPFRTRSVRGVSRHTPTDRARPGYLVECGEPARLPGGGSILVAPVVQVPEVAYEGPTAFVGRPWQATARTARDAVDARGVVALRETVARGVRALGTPGPDTVDLACPLGGSAVLSASIGTGHEEHRYAFAGCVLADGTRLDGHHDSDVRRQDEGDSVRRSLEERFSLRIEADAVGGHALLEAYGTVSDALTGKRADACGLLVQESVLRIDVPGMRVDRVAVSALAIEDITNARIEPAGDGGCGRQVHEHAFSDSGQVEQTLGDGTVRRFRVNRTGSVLLDADGVASSSGRDAMIRIYDADNDDSLDIAPDYARADGATITIDRHPGQVRFAGTWRFVER